MATSSVAIASRPRPRFRWEFHSYFKHIINNRESNGDYNEAKSASGMTASAIVTCVCTRCLVGLVTPFITEELMRLLSGRLTYFHRYSLKAINTSSRNTASLLSPRRPPNVFVMFVIKLWLICCTLPHGASGQGMQMMPPETTFTVGGWLLTSHQSPTHTVTQKKKISYPPGTGCWKNIRFATQVNSYKLEVFAL